MIKKDDMVDEVRKIREATYKKCNYNLHTYCEYVTKEAEKFKKEIKTFCAKKTTKNHPKKAA